MIILYNFHNIQTVHTLLYLDMKTTPDN